MSHYTTKLAIISETAIECGDFFWGKEVKEFKEFKEIKEFKEDKEFKEVKEIKDGPP